jgi:hypothetical protein
MNDNAINEFARNFLAIIAGVFTAIAAAVILLPLVKLVPSHTYETYFSTPLSETWKKDLPLLITMTAWLFISSLAGGFVCTLLSIDKELIYALIGSLVCLTVLFVVSEGNVFEMKTWQSWILLAAVPLGNIVGSGLGAAIKIKKRKKA